MLKPFRYGKSRELARTPIFRVSEHEAEHPRTGSVRPYVTLEAPDWVNLVALTPEGEMVLVRQWRHGTRRFELELPAGAQIGAIVRGLHLADGSAAENARPRVIVPHHDTTILQHDHVIVFVPSKRMVREIEKLFQVRATFF